MASRAAAQVGRLPAVLTGTVLGPASQPLAGALVQAVSVESQISRHATTDARGRFTIVFPDGGGQYDLTIRFIGMAPANVSVARQGDEDRLVANVQMGASAVALEAVTVSARRGSRLVERAGAGAVGRSLSVDQLSRLPVDALDLKTVAALAPGVLALAATDSTDADFSVAGPLVRNRRFVFGALQGRWRGQALPSLASADPLTLARLGVSPDSASRFLALAAASGAPARVDGLSDERTTENTLAFLRFDWKVSEAQTLRLRLDGRWDSQTPTRVSPLGLPPTGGTRTERGGGVMASLTSHFAGSLINEVRGYFSLERRDATALVAVPAGRGQVGSDLPNR